MLRWLLAMLAAASAILPTQGCIAADFTRDFAIVAIDAAAEARHGPMPLPREILAQALERIAADGARGAVLKFFLDQPRTASGDARLAVAIGLLPTALQARLDDSNGVPVPLPSKFHMTGGGRSAVSGKAGWLPEARFAAKAAGIGFVDFTESPIPLVESYQGHTVASLVVTAIELATGQKAERFPNRMTFGRFSIAVNEFGFATAPFKPVPPAMVESIDTVLAGSFRPGRFRGKVVVLVYDGPHGPMVDSPAGKIGVHAKFLALLRGLYEDQLH